MKRKISLLCCVLMSVSIMAGCGNTSAESTATTETAVDAASTDTAATEDISNNSEQTTEAADLAADSTNSDVAGNSDLTIDVQFAMLGTTNRGEACVYAISKVTNNGSDTYPLSMHRNLICKAYMNNEELERPNLGGMDVREELAAGETAIIADAFLVEQINDITFTWYDETAGNAEITSASYGTGELLLASKDFVNDNFDTAEYKDKYVMLESNVKRLLEDLGEL